MRVGWLASKSGQEPLVLGTLSVAGGDAVVCRVYVDQDTYKYCVISSVPLLPAWYRVVYLSPVA